MVLPEFKIDREDPVMLKTTRLNNLIENLIYNVNRLLTDMKVLRTTFIGFSSVWLVKTWLIIITLNKHLYERESVHYYLKYCC